MWKNRAGWAAIVLLALGITDMVVWSRLVVGIPLLLLGLILGNRARNSSRPGLAIAAIYLNLMCLFFALLVALASRHKAVTLAAREIAAATKNPSQPVAFVNSSMDVDVRFAALSNITDQAVLAEISRGDTSDRIRCGAMMMLTNPILVGRVAAWDKSDHVRDAAWKRLWGFTEVPVVAQQKLTDQSLPVQVVIQSEYYCVEKLKIESVADPSIWIRIAAEGRNPWNSGKALSRLVQDHTREELAATAATPVMRQNTAALLTIIGACARIADYKREEAQREILEIVKAMRDPLIIAELGEIKTLRTDWDGQIRQQYSENTIVRGERLTLWVEFSKRSAPLAHQWAAYFPDRVRIGTEKVEVDIAARSFLIKICEILSPEALAAVAATGHRRSLRLAALEKTSDQALLSHIGGSDSSQAVREAAIKRIADPAVARQLESTAGDAPLP